MDHYPFNLFGRLLNGLLTLLLLEQDLLDRVDPDVAEIRDFLESVQLEDPDVAREVFIQEVLGNDQLVLSGVQEHVLDRGPFTGLVQQRVPRQVVDQEFDLLLAVGGLPDQNDVAVQRQLHRFDVLEVLVEAIHK